MVHHGMAVVGVVATDREVGMPGSRTGVAGSSSD